MIAIMTNISFGVKVFSRMRSKCHACVVVAICSLIWKTIVLNQRRELLERWMVVRFTVREYLYLGLQFQE